jgi:Leucine-rich repeat (LRR) protein
MTGFSGRDTALLLVALVFLHGVSAQTLRDDEQHLFAFLENVLPENSSLFNSSVPVCDWEGLSCIGLGAQRRIFRVTLGGMQLNGSIPWGTVGALSSLAVLDLSNNSLSGDIPYDVFKLSSLMYLRLSNNKFTGSLPWAVSTLYQLMELDLAGNLLSGTIPRTVGELGSLKFLDLHDNNFTGPMPALTHTKYLRYLDLSSNKISGTVPVETFQNPEMLLLNLSRNSLTGDIPSELNWLWKIRIVDLSENLFQGSIPNLPNLVALRLFFVHSNGLNGSFPYNVTRLPNLNSLSVANNKLTGPLPPLPWGDDTMQVLDCRNNSLSGRIPPGLLASSNLTIVRLGNNAFSGAIPTNLTDQLEELDLHSNNFTGQMPWTLPRLGLLKKLDLSSNQLNGSVQWGVTSERSSLQYLSLAQNQFNEGPLPETFTQMVNLVYLNLSSCNLNGEIPGSVGELRSLVQLDMSHNSFTGGIPPSLARITNLTSLDLSYNYLTGNIPQELVSLKYLSSLNLSFNNLSGEIPQWSSFSDSSFLGNPLLCGLVVNRACPLFSPRPPPLPVAPAPMMTTQVPPAPRSKDLTTSAIVGITLGLSLVCLAALFTFVLFHQRRYKKAPSTATGYVTNPVAFEADPSAWAAQIPQPASIPVIMFEKPLLNLTFADLVHATNKFHSDSQLPDGRYGPSFKGVLPGGFQIVVKVLYDGGPCNELEKAAQLEALGKIRHENLVSLVGYCLVAGERLLVYEFMENGDVYQRLHDPSEGIKFRTFSKLFLKTFFFWLFGDTFSTLI